LGISRIKRVDDVKRQIIDAENSYDNILEQTIQNIEAGNKDIETTKNTY
jgi:hypothetical protein